MSRRASAPYEERVRSVFATLLLANDVSVERTSSPSSLLVESGRMRFVVEVARDSTTASVVDAAIRARATAARIERKAIPLLVVPFAGNAARAAADRERVGWVDLAGNAMIRASSVFIHVDGRANPEPKRGRPLDPFAPRARRVAACLVANPARDFTQRELANEAGLDEGRTSRVVRGLVESGYVERTRDRRVRLVRRDQLIDAYRDARPFEKEPVMRGNVAARSNDAAVRSLRELLEDSRIPFAATGLLGAHAYLGRPAPKLATFYVERIPTDGALALAGFQRDEARANVLLVVPRDSMVFERSTTVNGLDCAPALDVLADLASHPDPEGRIAADLRKLL